MLRTPQHQLEREIHQRTDAYDHVSATTNLGSSHCRTTAQIVAVAGCNGIHAEVIAGDGVHGSLRETLDQYLKLLDWTGRAVRSAKTKWER